MANNFFVFFQDKIRLQRVRLMVEIFGCDLDFLKSATSQIITNSKSKECGPLSLHDVNPVVSCVQSRTKIMMLSFFKLVSFKSGKMSFKTHSTSQFFFRYLKSKQHLFYGVKKRIAPSMIIPF